MDDFLVRSTLIIHKYAEERGTNKILEFQDSVKSDNLPSVYPIFIVDFCYRDGLLIQTFLKLSTQSGNVIA